MSNSRTVRRDITPPAMWAVVTKTDEHPRMAGALVALFAFQSEAKAVFELNERVEIVPAIVLFGVLHISKEPCVSHEALRNFMFHDLLDSPPITDIDLALGLAAAKKDGGI